MKFSVTSIPVNVSHTKKNAIVANPTNYLIKNIPQIYKYIKNTIKKQIYIFSPLQLKTLLFHLFIFITINRSMKLLYIIHIQHQSFFGETRLKMRFQNAFFIVSNEFSQTCY